jgi:hypothetical protein
MYRQVPKIAQRASNRNIFLDMSLAPAKNQFFHMFLTGLAPLFSPDVATP